MILRPGAFCINGTPRISNTVGQELVIGSAQTDSILHGRNHLGGRRILAQPAYAAALGFVAAQGIIEDGKGLLIGLLMGVVYVASDEKARHRKNGREDGNRREKFDEEKAA